MEGVHPGLLVPNQSILAIFRPSSIFEKKKRKKIAVH
jgi:hypothetical protein